MPSPSRATRLLSFAAHGHHAAVVGGVWLQSSYRGSYAGGGGGDIEALSEGCPPRHCADDGVGGDGGRRGGGRGPGESE